MKRILILTMMVCSMSLSVNCNENVNCAMNKNGCLYLTHENYQVELLSLHEYYYSKRYKTTMQLVYY